MQSTPGEGGGASPAYSAVPKSRELSAPFKRRGCGAPPEGVRGGASPTYSAVPKSQELYKLESSLTGSFPKLVLHTFDEGGGPQSGI